MEILAELLLMVLQFFGELLLQIVLELLAEAGVRIARAPFEGRAPVRAWLAVLGYIAMGAAAGAFSLWLFPQLFIQSTRMRMANLLLTPVASGAAMAALGAWRAKRQQGLVGLDRFVYGFLFALSMATVRFFYGH
ncbi:hypothetical protein [Aquabacterium sp.]|uniref:hypothetical protein n=1 Tax=Aquabacterium sp. TaxID=1872578 RepID=UPI00378362EC